MTGPAAASLPALSALRLVSYVPPQRDAVHVGLLTPDAASVIDLAPLGITDVLEAIDQLPMLRQAAGAIVHGAARVRLPVQGLHLVAPIPMARSVQFADVQSGDIQSGDSALFSPESGDSALFPSALFPPKSGDSAPIRRDAHEAGPLFADPATLQGPGGHLGRAEARLARVGLAAVVGAVLTARATLDHEAVSHALIGTVLVLGWPQAAGEAGAPLQVGAAGPYLAVPQRQPASLTLTTVAPPGHTGAADRGVVIPAPAPGAFVALARAALRSHALQPGDLLAIFPPVAPGPPAPPVSSGSWLRGSAPGLGTLSLAVR
ncbi:MAG: hypothetical protein IT355_09175 [Gemmatimonadaceae bacterium]|nr:hypothetical protein [Gemmatimonadaceae bacterium]